jgi:hypothetical protein
MVRLVAADVEALTPEECGQFLPEECPDEVIRRVPDVAAKQFQ